jgi:hypothetical protein
VGFLLIFYFIVSVFKSLKRGYVFINRQQATKSEEPLGFWLIIMSWVILTVLISVSIAQWFTET